MLTGMVFLSGNVQAADSIPAPSVCEVASLPFANWTLAQNAFAWKYFQSQAAGPDAQKNFAFSPSSLSTALQMLLIGANDAAKSEITNAIHAQGLSLNELMPNIRRMNDKFAALTGELRVRAANSLWTDSKFQFADAYLTFLQAIGPHNLTANSRDFQDPATLQAINDWVKQASTVRDHTSGKDVPLIEKVLEELKPDDVFVLLATLLVDGKWKQPFHEEEVLNFLGDRGVPLRVLAATGEIRVPHLNNELWEIVSLPLADPRIVVDFVMPKAGQDAATLLAGMTAENYATLLSQTETKKVKVTLPTLDITSNVDLSADPVFRKTLGINAIFETGNLKDMGSDQLYISQARHDSHVKVTGQGYQGFSVTTIVGGLECAFMPPPNQIKFTADRPYWMIVRDTRDNQILQMTRVAMATDKVGAAFMPQETTLQDTTLAEVKRIRTEPSNTLANLTAALEKDPFFSENGLPSLAAQRIATDLLLPENMANDDIQGLFHESVEILYGARVVRQRANLQ